MNVTEGSTNPRNFFQDDIHPGTVGNGVFANMAIAALNLGYGQNIAPISDLLMLQKAGLTSSYTGQTSNLPYANYVYFNAVPEPSTVVLLPVVWSVWRWRGAALPGGAKQLRAERLLGLRGKRQPRGLGHALVVAGAQ